MSRYSVVFLSLNNRLWFMEGEAFVEPAIGRFGRLESCPEPLAGYSAG